ncbi:hypothetical protein ACP70R_027554 [Stipagrostis hirtigluma subsp. patula]
MFRFPLSNAECRKLGKVTLTIMERDKFYEDTPVGETRVHVGEIIMEGIEREFLQMKPAPYNIVLEDGTYKGALKLGIKFISNVVNLEKPNDDCMQCSVTPKRPSAVTYGSFPSIALRRFSILWRRFFFFCTRSHDG